MLLIYFIIYFIINTFLLTILLLKRNIPDKIKIREVNTGIVKMLTVVLAGIYLLSLYVSIMNEVHVIFWHLAYPVCIILVIFLYETYPSLLVRMISYVVYISILFIIFGIMGLHLLFPDHVRYANYALLIERNGRWISWKYPENSYYQFFHVTPYMLYIVKAISSLDPYTSGFAVLTFSMYLATILSLLILALRVMGVSSHSLAPSGGSKIKSMASLLPILIAVSVASPPSINYALGGYGIAIALLPLALLSYIMFYKDSNYKHLILLTIISVIGVLSHPAYALGLWTFMIITIQGVKTYKRRNYLAFLIPSIIVVIYWAYAKIMEDIVLHEVSAFRNMALTKLSIIITGRSIGAPAVTGYSGAPGFTMYAWSLVPAVTSASALAYMIAKISDKEYSSFNKLSFKAAIVFTILALLYYIRGTGRYLIYWYYIVLIPLASVILTMIVKRSFWHKLVLLTIIFVSLLTASFDPVVVPEATGSLALTDNHAWITGNNVGKLLSLNTTPSIDMRLGGSLGVGLFHVYGEKVYTTLSSGREYSKAYIIGFDEKGIFIQQRKFTTILGQEVLHNINTYFDKVYDDGVYRVFVE